MRTTEPDRRTGVAALETRELTLRIDGAVLVQDVSLSVEPGELLAVIGPNGAGKTSLFDLITGIRRPTSGTVTLAGREITRLGVSRRSRLGLGRTFQTSSVFPALPVAENVRLAARAHSAGRGGTPASTRSSPTPWTASGSPNAAAYPRARCRTATNANWSWRWSWSSNRTWCCWTSRWPG